MGPEQINSSGSSPPGRTRRLSEAQLREFRRSSIMHVDMDAFFVSVELRSRPELMGKPVIVGYPADRSVVLSASYEARTFGVRSAMPMVVAASDVPPGCHHRAPAQALLRSLRPDHGNLRFHHRSRRASQRGRGFPGRRGSHPAARSAPRDWRTYPGPGRGELGITASVGIAASKFVAKIASTRCKPDGLLLITPEETVPVPAQPSRQRALGSRRQDRGSACQEGHPDGGGRRRLAFALAAEAAGSLGEHVYRLSWGIDPRPVTPVRLEKSIGAEETFATDTADETLLHRELLRLSHRTAERLRSAGMHARTVALKLRYADFSTITRSRTVSTPIDSAQLLYAVAVQLLESVGDRPMTVRLVGIRAEQLEEAAQTPPSAQPGPPRRQLAGR